MQKERVCLHSQTLSIIAAFGLLLQPDQVVLSTNLFFKINVSFSLVTGKLLQNMVDVTSETYKLYNSLYVVVQFICYTGNIYHILKKLPGN